ncbi:MAG: TerB family tellurite resistance protein [Bacteroidales bacterium]|nr:TerB family tellurite resistance protein [Bacteroidales bacterium]
MRGPSTFEDLAAVIAVCLATAREDGKFDEIEFKTILEGLRAQYNFEGRDDLLAEYVKYANEMDLEEAVRRIKNFDAEEKQFTSDMLFMTIVCDDKLTPQEEEIYKGMIEVCDLPLFTGADKL